MVNGDSSTDSTSSSTSSESGNGEKEMSNNEWKGFVRVLSILIFEP